MPTVAAVGGSSQSAEDYNNDVYIPLQTCKARYGENGSSSARAARTAAEQVEAEPGHADRQATWISVHPPTGEVVRDLLEG